MISGDRDEGPEGESGRLERLVARFEDAWARGERPEIEDFLSEDEPLNAALVVELVHAELEFRIRAGEAARVEEYLLRFPGLADNRPAVLGLIQAEWSHRLGAEPGLTIDHYQDRFPDYRAELEAEGPESGTPRGVARGPRATPQPEGPLPRRMGKYELRERVGAGSFGVVYRAWDTILEREVALKVPRPETLASPSDVRAFLREARSAIGLRHPHIVEIFDAGPIDGTPCVVRAFVDGPTLAEWLREGPVTPEEAASLILPVAEALDHAHSRKIIHRDLKPSNILLDAEGRPRVADFGLAKRESGDSTLSPAGALGTVIGTPAYMSPEQARGDGHRVDARSDVFSLGVVLYELLTGSVPFQGRNQRLRAQIQGAKPPPPRSLNAKVPADLEAICLRALAKRPEGRYASAKGMADDLKGFLAGRPVVPPPRDRRRWMVRGDLAVASVATLAVALGVMTALWVASEGGRRRHASALGRALAGFEELAALPPPAKPDGPRAHRRFLDEVETRSDALLPRVDPDGDPEILEPLARAWCRLADREASVGSDRKAAESWSRAVLLADDAGRRRPGNPGIVATRARAATGLAEVLRRLGEATEAARLSIRAASLRDRVREEARRRADGRPGQLDAQLDLAEAAVEAARSGRSEDMDEADEIIEPLARRDAIGANQRRRLARLNGKFARWLLDAGQWARAHRVARRGLRLLEASGREPADEVDLARHRLIAARAAHEQGDPALDDFREASLRLEAPSREDPLDVDLRRDLGTALLGAGLLLVDEPGRLDEGVATLGRSVEVRRALRRAHPQSHADLARLAEARAAMGLALGRQGRLPASASAHLDAVFADAGAIALAPGVAAHRRDLARHAEALVRLARSAPAGPSGFARDATSDCP